MIPSVTKARPLKRMNYQYSDRDERPVKVAYFENTVLIDLKKVMASFSCSPL